MFAGAFVSELPIFVAGMSMYLSTGDLLAKGGGMQLDASSDGLVTASTGLGNRHVAAGCLVQVNASGQEVEKRSLPTNSSRRQ